MKEKYGDSGFRVVGIHTPEFDYEKDRKRVERAVARYKLDHPVFMDNDYGYWNALGNRYWPSFYLVDKAGTIRASEVGELHEGTAKGSGFEQKIKNLLAEKPS